MHHSRLFCIVFILALPLNAQLKRDEPAATHELVLRAANNSECPTKRTVPQVLSDGSMLLGVVDTVYLIGANGTVKWEYVTTGPEAPLALASSPAFNSRMKEIGVIGCDLFFDRLDAANGKEKWRTRVNGSSEYTQIAPYESGFLVVLDSHGSNSLQYWGEADDDFWQLDFPAHAELLVSGTKIYAVRRAERIVSVQELQAKRPTKQ